MCLRPATWAGTGLRSAGHDGGHGAHAVLAARPAGAAGREAWADVLTPRPCWPAHGSLEDATTNAKRQIGSILPTQPGANGTHLRAFWLFNRRIAPQAGRGRAVQRA